MEGDLQKLKNLTVIRLCSSHISKNIKDDINKFFKKENVLFIAAVIGGIFDLKTFEDVDSYLKSFFTILMSKFHTESTDKSFDKFKKFAECDEWISNEFEDEKESCFDDFETIYKNSKFFQKYDQFLRNFKAAKGHRLNGLYNPKFAATFVKKYVAYFPFWSSILTSFRHQNMQHANNGIIEGKIFFSLKIYKIIITFVVYIKLL